MSMMRPFTAKTAIGVKAANAKSNFIIYFNTGKQSGFIWCK
jgi:hypothetical protein